MNISWNISDQDIQKVKRVLNENNNPFFKNRRERNVEKKNIVISKDTVIKTMIMCLLTSQQRSGPNSVVGKFKKTDSNVEERKLADKIDYIFDGFGPKQSRNFL